MTGPDIPPTFSLAYVPGVVPTKWVRLWNERFPTVPLTLLQVPAAQATDVVRDRSTDAVLLRLPVDSAGLHAIPLYTETTVVVIPKDHLLTALDEVSGEDLADDVVLHPLDDTLDWKQLPGRLAIERPATTAGAIELVAAGVGLLVVPQSLARLYHRKDLTYRPISDAPESQVALSWLAEETTDLVEQFIGVVRGRTVNSRRGRPPEPEPTSAPAKRKRSDASSRKPAVRKPASKNRKRRR